MKKWKPIIFENSRIPGILTKIKVAPIDVWAVSFFIFVFCKGKIGTVTKRHETIHYQQQLEMLFVFQWALYLLFWLWGVIKYKSKQTAYYRNPFEQEAYANEMNTTYLERRKRFSWWKYKV